MTNTAPPNGDPTAYLTAVRREPAWFLPMPPIVAGTALSVVGLGRGSAIVLTGVAAELIGVAMILVRLRQEGRLAFKTRDLGARVADAGRGLPGADHQHEPSRRPF
jgi:hypothetical protein